MSDQNLRSRLIRLAHLHPEVRDAILPLLEASSVRKSASSASPVPLTSEQKSFLKDLVSVLDTELRQQHVDYAQKFEYKAFTVYQTGKIFTRDGFGRISVLTDVPHVRIKISIPVEAYDLPWPVLSTYEFLLSADGNIAIMRDDTPWGHGLNPMTSREIGIAWAKSVLQIITH